MSTAGFSANIAIFDALMMGIMEEKDYGPAELALIHPGVRLATAFINAAQVFGNPFDADEKNSHMFGIFFRLRNPPCTCRSRR